MRRWNGVRLGAGLLVAVVCAGIAGAAHLQAAVVKCNGVTATIVRGNGNDVIVGTANRDVISAGGGRDIVFGKGGNDLICGGPGADSLDGMAGTDVLYGGTGRDVCWAAVASEHQFHHECEVHITAPSRNPRAPALAPNVAPAAPPKAPPRAAPAVITPAASFPSCSDQVCFAGTPRCQGLLTGANGQVSLVDGGEPVAQSIYQGGYIDVSLEIDVLDTSNFAHAGYGPGPVQQYYIPNRGTNYYVPPNPGRIAADSGFSNVVFMWFNWWNPATQSWTGWYYKQATSYIDAGLVGASSSCMT
jgi:Ca2+-binding RTX toxin-like protein